MDLFKTASKDQLVTTAAQLVNASGDAHQRAITGADPQPGDIEISRTAGAAVTAALNAGATGNDINRARQ